MRYRLLVLLLTMTFLFPTVSYSAPKDIAKKLVFTEWLGDATVKYSLLTSFCVAQGTTGLIESAKYGGIHISNSADDYHAYRFVQDLSWMSTGWFSYATIKQANKPWWAKASRIIGCACYGRNANELVYRWNVTGSPFNYSNKYTSNKKAIVLIKWNSDKGKFVDFYIPGTGKQGAIIDVSFFVAGYIFNKIGDVKR